MSLDAHTKAYMGAIARLAHERLANGAVPVDKSEVVAYSGASYKDPDFGGKDAGCGVACLVESPESVILRADIGPPWVDSATDAELASICAAVAATVEYAGALGHSRLTVINASDGVASWFHEGGLGPPSAYQAEAVAAAFETATKYGMRLFVLWVRRDECGAADDPHYVVASVAAEARRKRRPHLSINHTAKTGEGA